MPCARRHALLAPVALLPAARADAMLVLAGEELAPYSFEEKGRPLGLHLRLCREALAPLGLSLQWRPSPWRRALADLDAGLLDGVIGATRGNLNEREQQMAFPDEPLSWTHSVFVSRRERPVVFDGLFTLRGLRIAVLAGYQYSPDFMAAAYFERQAAASHAQSLRMLLAGRVEAALMDVASARFQIHQQRLTEQLYVDTTPVAPGRLYLGFSRKRGQERWAKPFGAALRAFKRGPGFDRLLADYRLSRADVTEPKA